MPVSRFNLSALKTLRLQQKNNSQTQSQPTGALTRACGIEFDATAVLRSQTVVEQLQAAAEHAQINHHIQQLFAGDKVNISEAQPALHMALRDPQPDYGLDSNHKQAVAATRTQLIRLADSLHHGHMPSGEPIKHIVHIGIGGSDLSPRLLNKALSNLSSDTPAIHFLSSPANHWPRLSAQLDPTKTLLIAASKSFGTAESLHNLELVQAWQNNQGFQLAVTAQSQRAQALGFDDEQILPLWPWVGGRYAFCSAVSLAAAISMGSAAFQELLAGAYAMDQHVHNTAVKDNLAVNMALVDYWQHVVGDYLARGVFSFDPRISLLAAWLQQLETESNGKSVDSYGEPLNTRAAPLVFGADGSDAQHALFQQLHQGQTVWPLEFIGVKPPEGDATAQLLFAQLLGQASTFQQGHQKAPAHARLRGGRPVTKTLLDKLDAWHLGALLAVYEHKTFCFGQLIGCNPFDQWGVEAGKQATQVALRERNNKE